MKQRHPSLPSGLAALAALYFLLSSPAHATATFNCEAADRNIPKLMFEGHMPYDNNQLLDFRGEIEIEPGRTIELGKQDVKKSYWKKTMAFELKKQTASGTIEIKIRTGKSADDIEFPGTYEVRAGGKVFKGKAACAGG